jgi:hypothetical protein
VLAAELEDKHRVRLASQEQLDHIVGKQEREKEWFANQIDVLAKEVI